MVRVTNSIPRLKASSLIEVTVALVIISLIFTVAITIYLNVQRSGFSTGKLMHNVLLDDAYNQAVTSKKFVDKEIQYKDVTVFQSVIRKDDNKNLVTLRLELRNTDGVLLGERKYILYVPV